MHSLFEIFSVNFPQPVFFRVEFELALPVREHQPARLGHGLLQRVVDNQGQHVVVFGQPGHVLAGFFANARGIGNQADQAVVAGQGADALQRLVQHAGVGPGFDLGH